MYLLSPARKFAGVPFLVPEGCGVGLFPGRLFQLRRPTSDSKVVEGLTHQIGSNLCCLTRPRFAYLWLRGAFSVPDYAKWWCVIALVFVVSVSCWHFQL